MQCKDQLQMLSVGAWHDGCATFQTRNLSDAAALQRYFSFADVKISNNRWRAWHSSLLFSSINSSTYIYSISLGEFQPVMFLFARLTSDRKSLVEIRQNSKS